METPINLLYNGLPITDSQLEFLQLYNNITTGLSLLAIIVFFISILLSQEKTTNLALKLVCNLIFADFIYTLSNIISNFSSTHPTLCKIEGFMKTFSLWSSVLWATIIGFVAYCKTVQNSMTVGKRYRHFCVITYMWSLIVSILPLIPGIRFYYETDGFVCWIHSSDFVVMIRWLFFYCWVWFIIIVMTVLYLRIYLYIRNLDINTAVFEYRGIVIYPVILYLILIPISIGDTELLEPYLFIIMIIQVTTLHLLGVFNVLAYGSQKIRNVAKSKKTSNHQELLTAIDQALPESQNDLDSSRMSLEAIGVTENSHEKIKSRDESETKSLQIVLRKGPL